ncbi:tyrosine-type recombinase/integrase [Streptomyces sp. NPDC056084]|uniref:tyrosine-type recombinase/integrase n=1 Tax=unclassified Streptomyces TaxID=2593676 RepID=UPI0035D906F8
MEDFVRHPDVRPLPGYGLCQVAACYRERGIAASPYCQAHHSRRQYAIRHNTMPDEEIWKLITPAVAEQGAVSMRGLPEQVMLEFLYGVQQRNAEGIKQQDFSLRPLVDLVRAERITSLEQLDLDRLSVANQRRFATGYVRHIARLGSTPETERHKDIWDASVFGLSGVFRFDDISQKWLREALQAWALDDIPKRYGNSPRGVVQRQINNVARLSKSLRLSRDDKGVDLPLLGRDDLVFFLNRLRFLHSEGEISASQRLDAARDVRRLLNRMRTLGLTQAGQPLHGIADTFTLREEDMPEDAEDDEAGRDLPPEVMRHICHHLPTFDTSEHQHFRTVTEIVIDTGRRPNEICKLPLDCLDRDEDGKPVLVYDNRKALRMGRRLPIAEATAGVIVAQQERTRARFPAIPASELVLFPSIQANPHGDKAISATNVADQHRQWVTSLPDVLVPVVVEVDGKRVTKMLPFNKDKIFPYAYRHTYAQRHADAGVPIDVLNELMDHRQLDTTQRYYRVGEKRRREAVEKVTAMQFDRHGNRIWRAAKQLLDSEHARRAVGEVAVPYGVCTEPANVAAGGHDCAVRFRCVGCGHFRTDVSYLPDLEAYLADLLRNRERLAAFVDADEWAKVEAMPSDEEITRVRRLVHRVRDDLEELTDDDRAQIQEAVKLVRRSRGAVSLGMPRIRQPLPDIRPERSA